MRNGPEEKRPPYLPSGYYLDEVTDPDTGILRRGDGSEVAASASVSSPRRCNGRRGRTVGDATRGD